MITKFSIFEGYDNDYAVGDYVYYYGNFNIYNVVKIVEISNDSFRVNVINVSGMPGTERMFYTWIGKFMTKGKANEEEIDEYKRFENEVEMRSNKDKFGL